MLENADSTLDRRNHIFGEMPAGSRDDITRLQTSSQEDSQESQVSPYAWLCKRCGSSELSRPRDPSRDIDSHLCVPLIYILFHFSSIESGDDRFTSSPAAPTSYIRVCLIVKADMYMSTRSKLSVVGYGMPSDIHHRAAHTLAYSSGFYCSLWLTILILGTGRCKDLRPRMARLERSSQALYLARYLGAGPTRRCGVTL
jgi:hypothetical protein